jgi:hypothetical protein
VDSSLNEYYQLMQRLFTSRSKLGMIDSISKRPAGPDLQNGSESFAKDFQFFQFFPVTVSTVRSSGHAG